MAPRRYRWIFAALAILANPAAAWDTLLTTQAANVQRYQGDTLWMGTEGGLLAYNLRSNAYRVFDTRNSGLPSNSVTQIRFDGRGGLWILAGKKLLRREGAAFRDQGQTGWDFVLFDTVPIVAGDSIRYRTQGSWKSVPGLYFHYTEPRPTVRIEEAAQYLLPGYGRFWVVGYGYNSDFWQGRMAALDARNWTFTWQMELRIGMNTSRGDAYFSCATSAMSQDLWLLAKGRIYRYSPGNPTPVITSPSVAAIALFPTRAWTTVPYLTADGRFFRNGNPHSLGVQGLNLPPGDTVLAQGELRSDTALEMGLIIRSRPFLRNASGWAEMEGFRSGAPSSAITALAFDTAGSAWVGTLTGLYRRSAGAWIDHRKDANGPGGAEILRLTSLPRGEFLAITSGQVFRWDGRSWHSPPPGYFSALEGIPAGAETDRQGNLWIYRDMAMVYCARNGDAGAWPWDAPIPVSTQAIPSAGLVADAQGDLWISYSKLYRRVNGDWMEMRDSASKSLWRDARHSLFSWYSDSVYRWTGNGWQPLFRLAEPYLGTPSRTVTSRPFTAPDQSIWAIRNSYTSVCCLGNSRFDSAAVVPLFGSNLIGRVPLLPGPITAVGFDAAGTLWVGNESGLLWGSPATVPVAAPGRKVSRLHPKTSEFDPLGRWIPAEAPGKHLRLR